MDPPAPLSERLRALRYFVNNLAPGLRSFWIHYSDRMRIAEFMSDDLARLGPDDSVDPAAARYSAPRAVVLNSDGVLLGTIDQAGPSPRALDAMNSNPQTIRPDMTPRLATRLLKWNPYLIVTSEKGRYLGRYVPAK